MNLRLIRYKAWRDQLRNSNCQDCGLCKTRNNIVVDRGLPSSAIFLLGEAPGPDEERTGFSLMGAAGQVLHRHLKVMELDSAKDVLIGDCVRCRPPGDRKPKKSEIKACWKNLDEQILLARPKIIVLLGSTSAAAFTGRAVPMQGFAGRIFDVNQFPQHQKRYPFLKAVQVAYHPSASLFDPSLTGKMLQGWANLRKWAEENKCLNRQVT